MVPKLLDLFKAWTEPMATKRQTGSNAEMSRLKRHFGEPQGQLVDHEI